MIGIVTEVVTAYVSNNVVAAADIPRLIADVHQSFSRLAQGAPVEEEPAKLVPAVPIKASVTRDYVVCLEDGKRFQSLKRHLKTRYNLTPDEYRARWGLPADHPIVAPNYTKRRSELAKQMGLGLSHRRDAGEPAVS